MCENFTRYIYNRKICTTSHGTVLLLDKFLAQFGLSHAGVVLIAMTPPTLRPHTGSMQSVLYAMHSCMYIRIGVGNIWLVKIPSDTPPPSPYTIRGFSRRRHSTIHLQAGHTHIYYTLPLILAY